MSDKYGSYPVCYSSTVETLYKLDNGVCPLCGKKVNKRNMDSYNIDHIVPQIVFKYSENNGLNSLCNGYSNLLLVHKTCNVKKGIDFLDINMLYLTKQRKKEILENIDSCKEYIEKFNSIRKKKLEEQNCKCAICQNEITEEDTILRRLDGSKKRSLENSAAICRYCNRRYSNYKNSINAYITISDYVSHNI